MERKDVKLRLQELAKSTQKRRVALEVVNTEKDAEIENKFFNELQADVYKNIIRSDY